MKAYRRACLHRGCTWVTKIRVEWNTSEEEAKRTAETERMFHMMKIHGLDVSDAIKQASAAMDSLVNAMRNAVASISKNFGGRVSCSVPVTLMPGEKVIDAKTFRQEVTFKLDDDKQNKLRKLITGEWGEDADTGTDKDS